MDDAKRFLDPDEFEQRVTIIFTAEERAQYKANVIRASAKFSSFEILSQVEESVLYVCNTDMPDNWPSLIPDVTTLIETSSIWLMNPGSLDLDMMNSVASFLAWLSDSNVFRKAWM